MAICNNCRTSLGCTCQIRKASDGKSCCSICLKGYEIKLSGGTAPVTAPTSSDAPTGVKVLYHGPGVQL